MMLDQVPYTERRRRALADAEADNIVEFPRRVVPSARADQSGEGSSRPSPGDIALAVEMAVGILENPVGHTPDQITAASETLVHYRAGNEPERVDYLRLIACMWLTNRIT